MNTVEIRFAPLPERPTWIDCETVLGQVVAGFCRGVLCRLVWLNDKAGRIAVTGLADEGRKLKIQQLLVHPERGWPEPLWLSGSAFQYRVWQALTEIPPGSVISYRLLARRIGKPEACRAVANACAANPVPVALPCHRIIRHDGRPGGYRWGLDKKLALLRREGVEMNHQCRFFTAWQKPADN